MVEHIDWAAWDRAMEAHDGMYITPEAATRKVDFDPGPMTDRDRNIADMHAFNRDVATLEETRLRATAI